MLIAAASEHAEPAGAERGESPITQFGRTSGAVGVKPRQLRNRWSRRSVLPPVCKDRMDGVDEK